MKQNVVDRIVQRIDGASVSLVPSENIYIEDVFEASLYSKVIARLPKSEVYDFIKHPDAALPDGTSTRKVLTLETDTIERLEPENQEFWRATVRYVDVGGAGECIDQ